MKRTIVGTLLACLLVSAPLVGCGSRSREDSASETTRQTTEVAEVDTEEVEEVEDEDWKESDELVPTPAESTGRMNLEIGEVANYSNGLAIAVTGVQYGLVNFDDSIVTAVAVTMKNTGSDSVSFAEYSWEGEDANGVRRNTAYYSKATNELGSGSLAPGGSVSGLLFFDEGIVRVVYTDNVWIDDSTAAWNL